MKLFKLIAAATLSVATPALAVPTYTLTDIGVLPDASSSIAVGINNLGQVVGRSGTGSNMRAFMWVEGTMTALPSLPGGSNSPSEARGINDAGQIVGSGSTLNASGQVVSRGIVWQDGGATSIGDLPGGPDQSQAFAINDQSLVAAISGGTSGVVAAQWQNGTLSSLSDEQSRAHAINSHGKAAGYILSGASLLAATFADGQVTSLGDLPGGATFSVAHGINDEGDVVGNGATLDALGQSATHATLWTKGLLLDLGDFAGGLGSSRANDINNAGRAVGYGFDPVGQLAAMWFDGEMFSLGSLVSNLGGWRLLDAAAINERGQIIGQGVVNGTFRAFLLTPDTLDNAEVPEPAMLGLFGIGFAGLALGRRRRRG